MRYLWPERPRTGSTAVPELPFTLSFASVASRCLESGPQRLTARNLLFAVRPRPSLVICAFRIPMPQAGAERGARGGIFFDSLLARQRFPSPSFAPYASRNRPATISCYSNFYSDANHAGKEREGRSRSPQPAWTAPQSPARCSGIAPRIDVKSYLLSPGHDAKNFVRVTLLNQFLVALQKISPSVNRVLLGRINCVRHGNTSASASRNLVEPHGET